MVRNMYIPFLVLLVIFISYLCLGALIFSLIEGPKEVEFTNELVSRIAEFLESNECIDAEEIEKLVDVIIAADQFGVSWSYHNTTSPSSWDFWSSLFFTTTLLTTIGYGHITPLGYSGKLFCIFYALLGVPLTLIFLTTLMAMFRRLSMKLYTMLQDTLGGNPVASSQSTKQLPIRMLHFCIILTSFAILFVILPSIVFFVLEPTWTYLDCYYFIFISLTTIGLGDFIPANSYTNEEWSHAHRAVYQTLVSVYLVIGLGVVLLVVDLFVSIPEVRSRFDKIYGCENEYVTTTVEQQELSPIPYSNGGYSTMEHDSSANERADLFTK